MNKLMKILIIDGQGGKLGAQIVSLVGKITNNNAKVMAIGTNALATNAMLKAGTKELGLIVATGENPVVCNAKDADIIIGPVGMVISDAMYGEVTPKMAIAIGQSKAKKVLIPINKCDNIVVGVDNNSMSEVFMQIEKIILGEIKEYYGE